MPRRCCGGGGGCGGSRFHPDLGPGPPGPGSGRIAPSPGPVPGPGAPRGAAGDGGARLRAPPPDGVAPVSGDHPHLPALSVASSLLAGGRTSRLYRRLVVGGTTGHPMWPCRWGRVSGYPHPSSRWTPPQGPPIPPLNWRPPSWRSWSGSGPSPPTGGAGTASRIQLEAEQIRRLPVEPGAGIPTGLLGLHLRGLAADLPLLRADAEGDSRGGPGGGGSGNLTPRRMTVGVVERALLQGGTDEAAGGGPGGAAMGGNGPVPASPGPSPPWPDGLLFSLAPGGAGSSSRRRAVAEALTYPELTSPLPGPTSGWWRGGGLPSPRTFPPLVDVFLRVRGGLRPFPPGALRRLRGHVVAPHGGAAPGISPRTRWTSALRRWPSRPASEGGGAPRPPA